jgi:hypothetical protein
MTGNSPSGGIRQQPLHSIRNDRGSAGDVEPGEPEHHVAGDGEAAITVAVGLEGDSGAVRGATVDLNDQPSVRPEEIHDVVEQLNVHLRLGKADALTESEEALFELTSGGR